MMMDPTSLPAPAPVNADGMGPMQPKPALSPKSAPPNDGPGNLDSSKQKAPNGRSFSEALGDDKGKDSLARMSSMTGRGLSAVKQSAALAFVTGQLEDVTPQEIPELVSKNPFINYALSSDIIAFMQTPIPLGETLKALGLDASFAAKAASLGVDLTEPVTPKDLLKSLGIDPQRVVAELSLLKQNLPFGGLAPYMQRAAALHGQKRASAGGDLNAMAEVGPGPDGGKKNKNQDPMMEMAGSAAMMSPMAMIQNQDPSFGEGSEPRAGMRQMGGASGMMPGASPSLSASVGQGPSPASQVLQMPQGMSAQSNVQSGAPQVNPMAGRPTGFSNSTTVAGDPFADLGQQLNDTQDKIQISGRGLDVQAGNRTLDALIAKQLGIGAQTEDALAPSTLNLGPVTSNMAKIAPPDVGLATKQQMTPSRELSGSPMAWADDVEPQVLIGKDVMQPMSIKATNVVPSAALDGSAVSSLAHLGSTPFSRSGDDDSERDGEKGRGDSLAQHVGSPQHLAKTAEHSGFQLSGAAPEAPVDRQAAVQKLLDASQMAVGQNGKTVHIDLGSHETGPLNVALRVDNGMVDIRVLTDSRESRNILSQELPRLRESLSQQNLTLGKVEVGVDSGWSRSFQQQNSQRWNNPANWSGHDQNRQHNFAENLPRHASALVAAPPVIKAPIRAMNNFGTYGQLGQYGQFGAVPTVGRDIGRIQIAV